MIKLSDIAINRSKNANINTKIKDIDKEIREPFNKTTKNQIKGLQDLGIGVCLKHFALNNRETEKLEQSSAVNQI